MVRHNLTDDEIKRIHSAPSLGEAIRVAKIIDADRERAERKGRCEWHDRENCGRCREPLPKVEVAE